MPYGCYVTAQEVLGGCFRPCLVLGSGHWNSPGPDWKGAVPTILPGLGWGHHQTVLSCRPSTRLF